MPKITIDDVRVTNGGPLAPCKMDPAVKAQWLKDLRSGEFTKCRNKLEGSPKRNCCLGVLIYSQGKTPRGVYGNDLCRAEIDDTLAAGLSARAQNVLAQFNDAFNDDSLGCRYTFDDIADFIEATF